MPRGDVVDEERLVREIGDGEHHEHHDQRNRTRLNQTAQTQTM